MVGGRGCGSTRAGGASGRIECPRRLRAANRFTEVRGSGVSRPQADARRWQGRASNPARIQSNTGPSNGVSYITPKDWGPWVRRSGWERLAKPAKRRSDYARTGVSRADRRAFRVLVESRPSQHQPHRARCPTASAGACRDRNQVTRARSAKYPRTPLPSRRANSYSSRRPLAYLKPIKPKGMQSL